MQKKDEKQSIILFAFTMRNYEEQFYLYKQCMGKKGQLPQGSSTQASAFSTDAEGQTNKRVV